MQKKFDTLLVSKEEMLRVFSTPQPANIDDMSVTLDVSKPLRFKETSDEQLQNILFMSVTFPVFRFSSPLTVVNFESS